MIKPLKKLVDLLMEEHRQLCALVDVMETILFPGPAHPHGRTRFRRLLGQFIELITTHGQREAAELFPVLQDRLPEIDHWQIRMLEIQDEAILGEARHLHERMAGKSSAAALGRLQEDGARLIRWMREHIMFEEERLFPRLL